MAQGSCAPLLQAVAYNNDVIAMVVIKPANGVKIANCLGFSITRTDSADGSTVVLETQVPFESEGNADWVAQPSTARPIQSYVWRDYTVALDHTYTYTVQALTGAPGSLTAIAGMAATTNKVTISTWVSDFIQVAFTRGIMSTQWMARSCPKTPTGDFDFDALETLLKTPGNPLRVQLMGNVKTLLETPLSTAASSGGHAYGALYEFTDSELIDFVIQNIKCASLLLGDAGPNNSENAATLQQLQQACQTAGAGDVTERSVPQMSIPHNKRWAVLDAKGKGVCRLSGAVNWTMTGMCTQSSNAIVIWNPELAEQDVDQWRQMKDDTDNNNSQMGPALRQYNAKQQPVVALADGTTVQGWYSPNTDATVKPSNNPPAPPDLAQVFKTMAAAQKFLGCLLFIPGYPSVASEIASLYPSGPNVIWRVAVSDASAVPQQVPPMRAGDPPLFEVAVAANAYADFATEFALLPDAHAIIHSKYVVLIVNGQWIVITGSHNLGYKASYQNDENLLIITGCSRLGHYYMVDALDVHDHYERNRLANAGSLTGYLTTDDSWQSALLTGSDWSLVQLLITEGGAPSFTPPAGPPAASAN